MYVGVVLVVVVVVTGVFTYYQVLLPIPLNSLEEVPYFPFSFERKIFDQNLKT